MKSDHFNDSLDNDDDEESVQNMNYEERYYLFKYFEDTTQSQLDQMIIEDAGVGPGQAKINLNKDQLKITIQTTKYNYTRIAEKVKELLKKDIKHVVINITEIDRHYVSIMNDRRINKDFQKKF